MAAPDDAPGAIAALRRARPRLPEGLASPTSEAAQALLEEILSMPTTPAVETLPDDDPSFLPAHPLRPHRHPRRALVVAAAVAALVAAAGVAAATTGDDGRTEGGETVEVGPATPSGLEDRMQEARDAVTAALDQDGPEAEDIAAAQQALDEAQAAADAARAEAEAAELQALEQQLAQAQAQAAADAARAEAEAETGG